jgi:mRNA interferase MazF
VKRGDVVVVAGRGPYTGKPRPALVVQSDLYNPTHASVTVCLISTDFVDASLFRIALAPGERTGLKQPSQAMIDKVASLPREQVSSVIGRVDGETIEHVDAALRRWLSL